MELLLLFIIIAGWQLQKTRREEELRDRIADLEARCDDNDIDNGEYYGF